MARVRRLMVWRDDEPLAVLRAPLVGRITCEYTAGVRDRYPIGTPLLSCSLPVRRGKQDAWGFVNGLLPEGQHRLAMAQQAGVTTLDLLGMLARYGRDVAGALVIGLEDDAPAGRRSGELTPRLEPLGPDDLMAEVARLPEHPLGLHDDSELSIAGLQDKLLLVRTASGWARPQHGYPSTHLLKVDDRVRRQLVRAEHTCLNLARTAGIPAADSELLRVGDAECLVVERFDRRLDPRGDIRRLHQEDACQALGIDSDAHDRRGKYEQYGGPTFKRVAQLLDAWGADPLAELQRLLERMAFTVAIGDADAHGKNISLLHPSSGEVALAPLYDTVPTALWPSLRSTAAMTVNGRDDLGDVTGHDLTSEAVRWGLSRRRAAAQVSEVGERLRAAVHGGACEAHPPVAGLVLRNLERFLSDHR